MSPLQALAFFVREALLSMRRGWKVSTLAVVTIAVSLFIGGSFLLVTGNLTRIVREWRREARVVVYLVEGAEEAAVAELGQRLAATGWVTAVEEVSAAQAEERFTRSFPGLADLLVGWEGRSFPRSLEISYDVERVEAARLAAWQRELKRDPAVEMVDDDRLWLRQVETLIALMRGVGVLLGGVLLAAATFTIASVIRLTAYLYRDEIAVLRLVGATEFMIRGPFFIEGLIQGFLGGALAVSALFGAYRLVVTQALPPLFGSVLFGRFLAPGALLALTALGALAGLFGAAVSLRRETVGGRRPA